MRISIEEYKKIVSKGNLNNKNPQRQLQGKINHELGQNFETQIENICEIYKLSKLAIIEKTPEPLKVLKHLDGGHFDAIFVKSAQPDFKGTLNGGRTIVFDAKFTETDRIRYQVLSDFQRQTLNQYAEFGAMSFVLVGFLNGNMYKIDINTWNNMKEIFGRKCITQEELDKGNFRVKKNKKGVMDFLN